MRDNLLAHLVVPQLGLVLVVTGEVPRARCSSEGVLVGAHGLYATRTDPTVTGPVIACNMPSVPLRDLGVVSLKHHPPATRALLLDPDGVVGVRGDGRREGLNGDPRGPFRCVVDQAFALHLLQGFAFHL